MAFKFNKHPELEGKHALLSASKYSWTNYSPEKFEEIFRNHRATAQGTKLHEFAKMAIELAQAQPRNTKTINMYINDCIGMRMDVEIPLVFDSFFSFGTADAIRFDAKPKNNARPTLYIFDLKTGVTEAKFTQLMIYAVLFCLEYGWRIGEIDVELRIYQNDEKRVYFPELDELINISDKLQHFRTIAAYISKEDAA